MKFSVFITHMAVLFVGLTSNHSMSLEAKGSVDRSDSFLLSFAQKLVDLINKFDKNRYSLEY